MLTLYRIIFGKIGTLLQTFSVTLKMTYFATISCVLARDARWFVFKPKIPIWVNFGGYCNEKSWSILQPLEISFGIHIVFPILVFCAKENLATLVLYKLGTVSVFRVSIP
jgi:hypothetical protein